MVAELNNGYVLRVVICVATKAIYLEATTEISTDLFLAAFTSFSSRRGCSAHIYSDNGTAFVGAAIIIKRNLAKFFSDLKHKITSENVF